ncbi:MAG: molybdopterin-guanine dinucleotide biosynthesis protein [Caulobacteraceae bacterium]|nr:molybdopterin-guanine dinucleotide biosynthesis protein [Caulobacteraceae bacterium]
MSGFHAIVLAAGSGSRFGGGKLMAPWRGGALIDGALDSALAAPVEDVRVVVGADPAVVAHVLSRCAATLVQAPDHALGLSASLKAGIASLPAGATGALIFLGDMPLVPQGLLRPLVRAVTDGAPAAVPVWEGRQGHPAAISSRLFAQVLALQGDRGARAVLDGLGGALVLIPAPDAGVLLDVDRPEDLPE